MTEPKKPTNPNQQGFLVDLLENEGPRIAVIVADGLRYELAMDLAIKLEKTCKVNHDHRIADIPSETEHNMSQLYSKSGQLIPDKKNREKALKNEISKKVSFKHLKDAMKTQEEYYLVLSCGYIDTLGESLSIEGTRLFDNILEKIKYTNQYLLHNGFRKVFLIADHGFVLNAFLEISDKISILSDNGAKTVLVPMDKPNEMAPCPPTSSARLIPRSTPIARHCSRRLWNKIKCCIIFIAFYKINTIFYLRCINFIF